MAQEIRDKRTADRRWYDIDCSRLLQPDETLLSVVSIAADQGNLSFGAKSINAAPITYRDNRVAAVGKVLQVEIDGGTIPPGRPWLMCTIRPVFQTTLDGTNVYNPALEATVLLRLIDNPPA